MTSKDLVIVSDSKLLMDTIKPFVQIQFDRNARLYDSHDKIKIEYVSDPDKERKRRPTPPFPCRPAHFLARNSNSPCRHLDCIMATSLVLIMKPVRVSPDFQHPIFSAAASALQKKRQKYFSVSFSRLLLAQAAIMQIFAHLNINRKNARKRQAKEENSKKLLGCD